MLLKLKRPISVLIAAILICSCFPSIQKSAYAEEGRVDKFAMIQKLGIINKTEHEKDLYISRGEFAYAIMRFMGYSVNDTSLYQDRYYFADIAENKYCADINATAALGLALGYSNGEYSIFKPDDYITYEQALILTVNALGYKPELSARKITAANKAAQLKITVASAKLSEFLTVGQAVELLWKALETPVLLDDAILENGNISYDASKTALEHFLNIKKIKGVVTSNSISSIDEENGAGEGMIKIAGKEYACKDYSLQSLMGYNVTAFIQTSDNTETVVYSYTSDNEVYTSDAEEIDSSTTIDRFVYYEKGRNNVLDIPQSVSVIVNGMVCKSYNDDTIKPENGDVTLIDNNHDGKIEVVSIEQCRDFIVDFADAENIVLYDKFGRQKADGDKKEIFVFEDGIETDFSAIQKDDVVSVYESDKRIKFVISNNLAIKGKITSVWQDNGITHIMLNDEEYRISNEYMALTARNKVIPNLGENGTFYFDFKGRIAGIVPPIISDNNYGLITAVASQSNLNPEILVRMMKSTGIWETFTLSQKAQVICGTSTLHGSSVNAEAIRSMIGYLNGSNQLIPQIVRYDLDGEGKIKKLYIAPSDCSDPRAVDKEAFVRNERITNKSYSKTTGIYDKWLCTTDTVFFGTPDLTVATEYDEDDFDAYLSSTPDGTYSGEVYAASELGVAQAVILYDLPGKTTYKKQTGLYLVTGISYKRNTDGEMERNIVCQASGNKLYFSDKDNVFGNNFLVGDLVQICMDYEKRNVLQARVVYRNTEVDTDSYFTSSLNEDIMKIYKNTFVKRAVWNLPNMATVISGNSTSCTLVHGYVVGIDEKSITIMYPYEERDTATAAYNGYVVRSYPYYTKVSYIKYSEAKPVSASSIQRDEIRPGTSWNSFDGSEVILNLAGNRITEVWLFERDN